jgi:hypothetical protein
VADPSRVTWGGWEPKVCYVCGKRVTLTQGSGHSFGMKRSWHTECARGPWKPCAHSGTEDERKSAA